MTTLEHELIQKIVHLSEEQGRQVLEFIAVIEGSQPVRRGYTLEELETMPPEQRSLAVAEAFALSADEDFELFEAFAEEVFDDESKLDDQTR
jgi:hypothetical protein